MSGTKLTYFILCLVQVVFIFAVSWNISNDMHLGGNDDILSLPESPCLYPDSFAVVTLWSPVYHGYDVHEALIYAGWTGLDVSIKSQIHPLMSNHKITLGFPVLHEKQVYAGIHVHYTCSFLYGIDYKHQGSVSSALEIMPQEHWKIGIYTYDFLSFPTDSAIYINDARIGAYASVDLFPKLKLSLDVNKYRSLAWDPGIGLSYKPFDCFSCAAKYRLHSTQLCVNCQLKIRSWCLLLEFTEHSYLGFGEKLVLAYVL